VKLITYEGATGQRVGVMLADGVHDAGFDGTMLDLIEEWPRRRDDVAIRAKSEPVVVGARVRAPLRPRSMRDFLAFEGHLVNAMRALGRPVAPEWYSVPAYYKGLPDTVVGPDDVVPWPYYATTLDHELELACVIGRVGKDIQRSEAMEHVFGYTIWNDFSARDVQSKELPVGMGPGKAKDWDGANVMGPVLVTSDELDISNLRMQVRVNGELWGEDSSGSMYHKFDELIAYASMAQTLYPGDVIGSGTAAGGSGVELGRALSPGDVVELEIEGIGILRNRVGTAPKVVEEE
jgi:2-keto-4-pentenoate hydratase/2-oxohepta-3-ene-1,7-dioic acid hydratase in catechol pathway